MRAVCLTWGWANCVFVGWTVGLGRDVDFAWTRDPEPAGALIGRPLFRGQDVATIEQTTRIAMAAKTKARLTAVLLLCHIVPISLESYRVNSILRIHPESTLNRSLQASELFRSSQLCRTGLTVTLTAGSVSRGVGLRIRQRCPSSNRARLCKVSAHGLASNRYHRATVARDHRGNSSRQLCPLDPKLDTERPFLRYQTSSERSSQYLLLCPLGVHIARKEPDQWPVCRPNNGTAPGT